MRVPFYKTAASLLLVSLTGLAGAAEWKIDPTLRFKAGYNDNIRLNVDDEKSSPELTFSPSALFSVETETSGTSGDLRFDFRRYTSESNLNDNNVRLLTHSFHKLERSELGLDLDFIKDTTLDSQADATGVVLDRVKRRRFNVGPSWTWHFDERTNLEFGYTYSKVKYDDTGDTGFVDFHINNFQTTLAHALTERATISTTLTHTRTSNDNQVDTKNTNLQGGGSYRFSETLSAFLFGGIRRTEADFSSTSLVPIFSGDTIIGFVPVGKNENNSDWGYTFQAGVTKNFLRGETTLSGSRDISNDINGTPIEVTRVGMDNLYRFTETLSANLNLVYYNSDANNSARRSGSREYYQFEPKFNWDFRQFWRISGSYRYKRQTYDNTSDDATQNAAYLTLIYQWPRIAVSR